jgi:hypothetical protein
LPPSALVIGSCAPDLAYLFDTGRTNFHAWPGILFPCLPAALALFIVFEALLLPSLARTLPVVRGVACGRFAATRGLPLTARGWFDALLALSIGTLTHVVWDGFTHARRFPANVLFPSAAGAMQVLSSVIGVLLVAQALKRVYPQLPAQSLPRAMSFESMVGFVAGALVVAWVMLVQRWGISVATSPLGGAWLLFWYGARGTLAGLALACVVETRLAMRQLNSKSKNPQISTPRVLR